MDETLRAMLETLPPRRRLSKLDPYAALIRELRRRGRSYRDIVAILREHCGVQVGLHAVYHFVQGRAQKKRRPPREHQPRARDGRPSPRLAHMSSRPTSTVTGGVWTRIAAVKARSAPAVAAVVKEFAYDENEPLQLIPRSKSKRERA
jgi:hypothetical protein